MDRDNASTATQADHGMTRRGVMRRTAIGVGAAATLGATASGSAAAVNLPSRDTVLTAAGIAVSPPLWAAKQVYDRVTDPATGEDINDDLAELNADETQASIYSDIKYMGSVQDRVTTSISNVIQGLDRHSYQKGIEKAITEMDSGASQSDTKTAAISAAMDEIAVTQKNILDHWNTQIGKIRRLAGEVESTDNLGGGTLDAWEDGESVSSGTYGNYYFQNVSETYDVDLADGTTFTSEKAVYGNGDTTSGTVIDGGFSTLSVRVSPVDTGEEAILNLHTVADLFTECGSIATTVENEITSWVDGIYPSYSAGDINLDELVTADQLQATASEQNDLSNVTADFASLGIPINDRTTLTIEIVAGDNSGTIIDGNLAVRNPPSDGFVVGDTYDPENISGPVWLMYDRTTDSGEMEGDVFQVENKFKVIDAEGYDGEPVSNVTFEEKTQERYSTDVQELNDQLDRIAEYQQEIQEERDALIEETTSGGGGGFLEGVGQGYTIGIAALVAGVLYLLGGE